MLVFQNQMAYNKYTVIICKKNMTNRKQKSRYYLHGCVWLFCVLFLGACSKKSYSYTQNGQEIVRVHTDLEESTELSDMEGTLTGAIGENASDEETTQKQYYVHICGAVSKPGVYCVEEGSRLYEVILLAGGMTQDAADEAVNQAEEVSDGMQIYIPTRAEVKDGSSYVPVAGEVDHDGRVNINTADLEQLCTLPGIGETRAQAILSYRAEHGAFQSVEELMNVAGIKAGVYEKIKELIRI